MCEDPKNKLNSHRRGSKDNQKVELCRTTFLTLSIRVFIDILTINTNEF